MSLRRLALAFALLVLAGTAATEAVAGRGAAGAVTTIKAVTSVPKVKVNRYIQDGLRWDKDVYKVKSGSTIHVVNNAADEGPHTLTIVARKDEPQTGPQIVNCKICLTLAKAHGANPNSD